MSRISLLWCGGLAALFVGPVILRVATWPAGRLHAVETGMVLSGEILFKHDWKPNDPLCQGGDGLGPVFNATSCVACHSQPSPGGSGGLANNVTTFTVRSDLGPRGNRDPRAAGKPHEGVVHARATSPKFQEHLALVHADLPPTSQPTLSQLIQLPTSTGHCLSFPSGVHVSQRNTPALYGARLIDELPDRVIIAQEKAERVRWALAPSDGESAPVGRALRLADGRVGRFGWKGQTASLAEFVQAACANELGLGNPGQPQPKSLARPEYQPASLDLSQQQCDQLTAFCLSLPRPVERAPDSLLERESVLTGKKLFSSIGCADCHTPDLGPIQGIYSDLLLHRMGQDLQGGGGYDDPPIDVPTFNPGEGPQPGEWRTPPLWGVADSAPYLHDGRAATLEEAIRMHAGQGKRAAQRFNALSQAEQQQLVGFLKTLKAP